MNKNKNRNFYFIETEDVNGNECIKVASDFAPMWGRTFASLNDALDAIKRRNQLASEIRDIKNGVMCVYALDFSPTDNSDESED